MGLHDSSARRHAPPGHDTQPLSVVGSCPRRARNPESQRSFRQAPDLLIDARFPRFRNRWPKPVGGLGDTSLAILSVPARVALFAACSPWAAACQRMPPSAPSAPSPSIPPTKGKSFAQRLPEGDYEFVELVERGRPDWLASACRQGVRCDLLVISGHFDGMTEFYSDRLAMRESLPVAEMERASCSDSCPGVFSQLKEVYLFGCNTMNAEPITSTSAEAERSLIRSGHSPADAQRLARALDRRHAESSRDHMRRIFMNVPAIYGFSRLAPAGTHRRDAAQPVFRFGVPARRRQRPPDTEAPRSIRGEHDGGRRRYDGVRSRRAVPAGDLPIRRRPPVAGGEARLHSQRALRRDMAEARMFLDRIEGLFASLERARAAGPVVRAGARNEIARDTRARERYLRFAEDADLPRTRARMIELAGTLGWLSPADQRAELVRMVGDLIERGSIGPSDIELVCSLNKDHRAGRRTAHRLAAIAGTRPTRSTMRRRSPAWGVPRRALASSGH